MMKRHRTGGASRRPPPLDDNESSEDDDEDAFAALSRNSSSRSNKAVVSDTTAAGSQSLTVNKSTKKPEDGVTTSMNAPPVQQSSITSSMKRHHGAMTEQRKRKMDALLQELEVTSVRSEPAAAAPSSRKSVNSAPKGSFVDPEEEHLTTNIFVGNLAPSITEEELTTLFRQFGDLYSVKIMWPRNPEEQARNRHTGFVCFMNRRDAEDAMEVCNNSDPFQRGRPLKIGWGKDVKKILQRDTSGSVIVPIAQQRNSSDLFSQGSSKLHESPDEENPHKADFHQSHNNSSGNGPSPVKVLIPPDSRRAHLISTVASFVAKDGSELEQRILQREVNNPAFSFMTWQGPSSSDEESHRFREHAYYKWRVYSFCRGDRMHTWRTEPFSMLRNGRLWLPPPLDRQASEREKQALQEQKEELSMQGQQRRILHARRNYMTGRQLEQIRKGNVGGSAKLDPGELEHAQWLFRKQLSTSREAICAAMAFCFEKSASADEISKILNGLLCELGPHVSVETRIARLYLLSDILFNSQQPGVKNAFRYRDSIEKMAPEVFVSLGKASADLGRLTMSKLTAAVRSVLAAWTRWGVYNPAFLTELEARFEGREIKVEPIVCETEVAEGGAANDKMSPSGEASVRIISQGQWTSVEDVELTETLADAGVQSDKESKGKLLEVKSNQCHADPELEVNHVVEADEPDEDAAGEQSVVVEDENGEAAEPEDADGESLGDDDDADGRSIDDSEVDGKPIDCEIDVDGVPLGAGDDTSC